jgi:hypothetical protein
MKYSQRVLQALQAKEKGLIFFSKFFENLHTSLDFIIKIGLSVNGRYGMLYMACAFKL